MSYSVVYGNIAFAMTIVIFQDSVPENFPHSSNCTISRLSEVNAASPTWLYRLSNPSGAEAEIFWDHYVGFMTADALVDQASQNPLTSTHCGRVIHICINKLAIIGSANAAPHGWRQAIIRNNANLLTGPLWTNLS